MQACSLGFSWTKKVSLHYSESIAKISSPKSQTPVDSHSSPSCLVLTLRFPNEFLTKVLSWQSENRRWRPTAFFIIMEPVSLKALIILYTVRSGTIPLVTNILCCSTILVGRNYWLTVSSASTIPTIKEKKVWRFCKEKEHSLIKND